jgi:pimeloyl-ACP methyl ester carboxylesterase
MGLPVHGFADAVVALPLGTRRKRPVIVATHGNYDRPDWQCDVWHKIVGPRAFVLCLRGTPRPDSPSPEDTRYWYLSNLALEHELDAAVVALQARFPDYVDRDRPLYTGFSLGAIMGVSIAERAPSRYPRLVLIEGGHEKWTPKSAAAYARGGGERVLFVCAQTWTANEAMVAARKLDRAGVATRVVHGPDVGHTYDGPTAEEIKRNLDWVLDGDPRWDMADGAGEDPED